MLARIHPKRDWAWLKQLQSAQGKPRNPGATYAHREGEQSLPMDQWPATWRKRWETAVATLVAKPSAAGNYDHLRGKGRRYWRPVYADRIGYDLGVWLWIMKEGGMEDPCAVNEESVQLFIDAKMMERPDRPGHKPVSRKWMPTYLKRLKAGFKIVLRHCPEFVSETVKEMKKRNRQAGIDERKEYRAEHPAVLAAIGLLLIDRSRRCAPGSIKGALLFRDGALFYLLAHRAMRVSTTIQLKLGEHLKIDLERGKIATPSSIMKAKRAWRVDLNANIVGMMRELVECHRCLLKNADEPWVFVGNMPSERGGLTAQAINKVIAKHTLAYLDKELSSHDFRYAIGTLVMEELPENPWMGSAMLQHHSSRTLTIYTVGADSIRASDRYAELADSAKKKAEQEVARMAA
jgi:site-specific recombinase XerD